MKTKHRIFTTSIASVYPHYVAKAEKKGRKKSEVDAVICWLTGYNQRELEEQLKKQKDFETFFKEAAKLNPSRTLIKIIAASISFPMRCRLVACGMPGRMPSQMLSDTRRVIQPHP